MNSVFALVLGCGGLSTHDPSHPSSEAPESGASHPLPRAGTTGDPAPGGDPDPGGLDPADHSILHEVDGRLIEDPHPVDAETLAAVSHVLGTTLFPKGIAAGCVRQLAIRADIACRSTKPMQNR